MPKATSTTAEIGLFDGPILRRAAGQAVLKLNPRGLARNPVIFVTGLTSVLVTILVIRDGFAHAPTFGIGVQIAIWLWFTVLFANFAEAIAEGRARPGPTPSAPLASPPAPRCWPIRAGATSSIPRMPWRSMRAM